MATLIHLNGPPGVGKSTLARRYAAEHPGTLACDIDRLRTWIGGWQSLPEAAGLSRTAGLATVTAYLRTGHDVVVPQLVAAPDQLARFRRAADDAGATYVGVLLTAEPADLLQRFRTRPAVGSDGWEQRVADEVTEDALLRTRDTLDALADSDASIARVASTDPDTTYARLLAVLREAAGTTVT